MSLRSALAAMLMAAPLAAPAPAGAQEVDRATALAREILDRGAALFDTRNAEAMADTYVEGGQIILITRDSDSDRVKVESRSGRAALTQSYADIFKDRRPEHRARNTVESARFLGPDLLRIEGRFALDREQGDVAQFVQIRAREGGQWKVVTMQLTTLPR